MSAQAACPYRGWERSTELAESEQESGHMFDASRRAERERFVTARLREFSE
jgi:hypothetical protein